MRRPSPLPLALAHPAPRFSVRCHSWKHSCLRSSTCARRCTSKRTARACALHPCRSLEKSAATSAAHASNARRLLFAPRCRRLATICAVRAALVCRQRVHATKARDVTVTTSLTSREIRIFNGFEFLRAILALRRGAEGFRGVRAVVSGCWLRFARGVCALIT